MKTEKLTIGAILGLLSIIASGIIYQNSLLMEVKDSNTELKTWTHSVHEYEIKPAFEMANDNKKKINNHEYRLKDLEHERKNIQ